MKEWRTSCLQCAGGDDDKIRAAAVHPRDEGGGLIRGHDVFGGLIGRVPSDRSADAINQLRAGVGVILMADQVTNEMLA
jgi:hypothetical protein